MRSVEDKHSRKTPLRRIGRLLVRPVRALNSKRRVQKRRAAATCSAEAVSAASSPLLTQMTFDDGRVPLQGVGKGIEEFTNALGAFLTSTLGGIAVTNQRTGFPSRVTPIEGRGRIQAINSQQNLIATGSKQWGSWWDGGGLLKVKIYDFALYTNSRQLTAIAPSLASSCGRSTVRMPNPLSPAHSLPGLPPLSPSPSEPKEPEDRPQSRRLRPRLPLRRRTSSNSTQEPTPITDRVRAATPQVEMSLSVRPARDLPLLLLRTEYRRILQKRLKAVGGRSDDAALRTLLTYFNPEKLPSHSTRGGCIRKGTTMTFSRSRKGILTTTANGDVIATVHSPKLCEAVFDLYLGSKPVCKRARDAAKEAYEGMITSSRQLTIDS